MMEGVGLKRKYEPTCDEKTDYKKCIICQTGSATQLKDVTPYIVDKLILTINARCDDVASRLQDDIKDANFVNTHSPKWHTKCRNRYIHGKAYKLMEAKRNQDDSVGEQHVKVHDSNNPNTRSKSDTFVPKVMCVICNKRWYRGKEPDTCVSTLESQKSILDKARMLGREDIANRAVGAGHDMIANDIRYHLPCMNNFKAKKPPKIENHTDVQDEAFKIICHRLEISLFSNKQGHFVKTLRDEYVGVMHDLGQEVVNYKPSTLRKRLQNHFGKRIAILEQVTGSGFICAASVPLGDAMETLNLLEKESNVDKKSEIIHKAGKILRKEVKELKKTEKLEKIDVSYDCASKLVPTSIYNFCASLLFDDVTLPRDSDSRIVLSIKGHEKVLMLAQQILQKVGGIVTPLAIGSAYHLYNLKRSKDLIILNHRLGQGISYETLHRQLTSVSASIMQQVEEEGAYTPMEMSTDPNVVQVFALDNLDWKSKTLEGGSFHATTSIVIENPATSNGTELPDVPGYNVKTSKVDRRSLQSNPVKPLSRCYLTKQDRQESKSLASIDSLDKLMVGCDERAKSFLDVWRFCRLNRLGGNDLETEDCVPGFSAFCAHHTMKHEASKIAYLPLIPQSPTDAAVMKEVMSRLVTTSQKLGNEWTIITGDQATYELARIICIKDRDEFGKVILMLGGFHLAHNFLKAIFKIMAGSGVEELLTRAGLCQEGTAKKICGEKCEYYQSMHALWVVNEAMWLLMWEAFEQQAAYQYVHQLNDWMKRTQEELQESEHPSECIQNMHSELDDTLDKFQEFRDKLKQYPTASLWIEFMEMCDVLIRFVFCQREGNWDGHLREAANMLPYLTAAGHYKYGQQSLPIYIQEMRSLETDVPEIHEQLKNGAFVGRRADGHHNGVSPDMLLEQTYNADAKEEGGLGGITENEASRNKWVYTRPVTAEVSSKFKAMCHLKSNSSERHHESGQSRVTKDVNLVRNTMAAVEINPFTCDSPQLLNVATGEVAENEVEYDLTHIRQIGLEALQKTITSNQKKISTVKIHTFQTQGKTKKKVLSQSQSKKNEEITALMRLTQVIACGGTLDVVDYIGNHECSKTVPSLFEEGGQMRPPSAKSGMVHAILDETGVSHHECIPEFEGNTSVIVDAMHMIHSLSFEKGAYYSEIADRYKKHLITLSNNYQASAIHFCCDRYRSNSLKDNVRKRRNKQELHTKSYDVRSNLKAPESGEMLANSASKANLQNYLCSRWEEQEYTSGSSSVGSYLCVGDSLMRKKPFSLQRAEFLLYMS